MEENKDIVIPQAFSDDLFNPKITGKQRKFILLLVHSEGLKTGRQCAIEAGYAPGSAVVRAAELQNPEKFPLVAGAIEELLLTDTSAVRSVRCLHWQELEMLLLLLVIIMLP